MTIAQKHEYRRMQDWGRRANIEGAAQDIAFRKRAKNRCLNTEQLERKLLKKQEIPGPMIDAYFRMKKKSAQRDGGPD